MLGTSEERRFFEPTGSQTHSHSSVTQETSSIPRLSTHPTTIFPPLFPPLSNFSHLTALHPTIFGGNSLSAIDFTLNRANTHSTANIWPGSATLSSTPTGQLSSAAPSNAVSSGRFSAFDLHPNNQGESFGYILFIILSLAHFCCCCCCLALLVEVHHPLRFILHSALRSDLHLIVRGFHAFYELRRAFFAVISVKLFAFE